MKSIVNTKSLFGVCPTIFSKRVTRWRNNKKNLDSKVLIVDDKDGYLALYSLRSNIDTTVYEPDDIFINGGKKNVPINIPNTTYYTFINRTIIGLVDRANTEFVIDKLNIINRNFYEIDNTFKYNYVTACKSLDRKCNEHFSMEEKINKLKNAVALGGYLDIEYYIALEKNNYRKYPKSRFFRESEIEKYFDNKDWTILSNEIKIVEDNISPLSEEKIAIVGYLDVLRKTAPKPRKKRTLSYKRIDYETNKEVTCVKNYIINGVVR